MSIIANQALEFSSQVSQGMQGGELWQWIAAKIDVLKGYLAHLNLPLAAGGDQLEQIVQTVVTNASTFIYTNAIGLIKGFTYFLPGPDAGAVHRLFHVLAGRRLY